MPDNSLSTDTDIQKYQ